MKHLVLVMMIMMTRRKELRLLSVGPNSSPSQIYLTCFALCWHESELGGRERSGDGNWELIPPLAAGWPNLPWADNAMHQQGSPGTYPSWPLLDYFRGVVYTSLVLAKSSDNSTTRDVRICRCLRVLVGTFGHLMGVPWKDCNMAYFWYFLLAPRNY